MDSILHQTYQDLEVLLVDDGSTDASGAICDEYAAQEARVTAVHQKNGGLSAARNAGLERAQGTYLCFVDSDDFLDSRMLETLCRDLQEQNADVAVVGFRMFEREEVKDLRSNIAYSNVEAIMDGDIDEIIEGVLIAERS